MNYKILSEKRNRIKLIVGILPLILFAILGIMVICEFYVNKILLLSIAIYMLLPISIIKNKIIGDLELTEEDLSFITEQGEYIRISLADIKLFRLSYIGAKGTIHLMAGGWSWNPGNSFLEIQTKDTVHKIMFLSECMDDEDKIFRYIDVLKKNNISFRVSISGRLYTSDARSVYNKSCS